MITKSRYDSLRKRYGHVGSWAVWCPAGDTPKSNIEDMGVFEDVDILNILNPAYVFIGLNLSSTHGEADSGTCWTNFHSGYAHGNDFKLRYALENTRYWGSYMTDLIKDHPEVDSAKVKSYLKEHPEVVVSNIDALRSELLLLGMTPTLIAMGSDVYNMLNDHLDNEFAIRRICHFACRINKEHYREAVLDALG